MARGNSTGASRNNRRGAARANSRATFSERGKSSDKPFKKNRAKTDTSDSFSVGKKPSDRKKTTTKSAGQSDTRDSKRPYSSRNKGKAQPLEAKQKPYFAGEANKEHVSGKGGYRKSFSKDGATDSSKRDARKTNKTDSPIKAYSRGEAESKPPRYSKSFSNAPKKFSSGLNRANKSSSEDAEGFPASSGQDKRFSSKPHSTRKSAGKRGLDEKTVADPDKIRLNRFIANSGLCSRREADEFITMGLVTVNGKVVTELGYKVNRTDEVRYEDKILRAEKPVYILMNKPKGYLTTTKDPQERNTIMHILGNSVKERVYPVGRLDRNTTGLLLLTNDGDLADKLMHPSYNVKKIYKVELDRAITKADFKKIKEGIYLEEGKAVVDDLAIVSDDNKTIGIEIHIGWNRVVRRIFESLQYDVVKLDRSVYAGLDKKDLPRGHWRFLRKEEVILLKHYK